MLNPISSLVMASGGKNGLGKSHYLVLAAVVLCAIVLVLHNISGPNDTAASDGNTNLPPWPDQAMARAESDTPATGSASDARRQIDSFENTFAAIVNLKFPSGENGAQWVLFEELKYLSRFPPGRDRDYLVLHLIENYIGTSFEDSDGPIDLRNRLVHVFAAVHASDTIGDREEVLLATSSAIAGRLAEQSAEAKSEFLELLKVMDTEGQEMSARISGACYAQDLLQSSEPRLESLLEISDSRSRQFAEQTILTTFDYETLDEEPASEFASYYLSDRSELESNHDIEIRLFGIVLKRFPDSVAKVILDAPPSLKRDRAIEQLIFRFASSDLEAAKVWYQEIDDAAVKTRAMLDITGKRIRASDGSP